MKWLLIGILVVVAHAGEEVPEKGNGKKKKPSTVSTARFTTGVLPPVAASAVLDKADDPSRRVVVNLNANGEMTIGGAGRSLADFAEILEKQANIRHALEQSGKLKRPSGVVGSTMKVLLRLDRDAPWVHAQWLMIMAAENKVYRLQLAAQRVDDPKQKQLAVPDSYVKAWLPMDTPVVLRRAPAVHLIRIHVSGRKEELAKFGPAQARRTVHRPTAFVYRIQNNVVALGDDFAKALRAELVMAMKAGMTPIAEIRAQAKIPVGAVMRAIDAVRLQKLEAIQFYGTAIPTRALRRSRILPYPSKSS